MNRSTNGFKFDIKAFIISYTCALHVFRVLSYSSGVYEIIKVKLETLVEGDPKAPFSVATTPTCMGGRYSFPRLLHFTLDPYLIMLSVKQGSINYNF